MLKKEEIENSISIMSAKYDTDFGEWIQNPVNCRLIGIEMRQYIEEYPLEDCIFVFKWIVRNWTFMPIVELCSNFLAEKNDKCNVKTSLKKISICQGIIFNKKKRLYIYIRLCYRN
ncbi:hypothetical protein CDIK_2155 [Cucumispora dikerogammari]|nr:hypothetical protein CDIK_2155 [Cucumispora dikerogammari]